MVSGFPHLQHGLQALIIDPALQKANQASGLNNILSSSVSDQLNLGNVGVNTQNVMAALTLGLAFPEVRIAQVSSSPATKLTPPSS